MDDEFASDSDDERKLFKASREAQQTVKRKRAESAAAAEAKRRDVPSGELQPQAGTSQRFSQGFWPATERLRMVEPVLFASDCVGKDCVGKCNREDNVNVSGLGPLARITRSMYAVLNARSSWCRQVLLTPEALE